MAKYKRKTRRDARKKVFDAHRKWARKLKSHPGKRRLSKVDKQRLEAFLGLRPYDGPIRASDLGAAKKMSQEYVDVIHAFQSADPGQRWFHVTLLTDELIISEREPNLLLRRLKGKADKELRDLRLNGVACIDVNALPNHPRKGRGGSILFHVHVLAFTDQPFDIVKARKSLAASRSWSCKLGAKPTHIVEITHTKGKACFWAAYDSKPPYEAKNRREGKDGKVKLMATEKGLRPNVAMRLLEGFSQLALRDRIFSVGEAKDLREEIIRRVTRWHRQRWPDLKPVKALKPQAFWRRYWKWSRTKGYKPWEIIGSTL